MVVVRRLAGLLVLLGLVAVVGTSWLSSTRTDTFELDAAERVVIVSSAGPVRVRHVDDSENPRVGLATATVTSSWLLSEPTIEVAAQDRGRVVRVRCAGRAPCRSVIDVFVPDGIDLVVSNDDTVQIDRFSGSLTVVDARGPVVLGAVDGRARVVSAGDVSATDLGVEELTVASIDGRIDLVFGAPPEIVVVDGGAPPVALVVPRRSATVDAVSMSGTVTIDPEALSDDPGDAGTAATLRSEGDVTVTTQPSP